MIKDTELAEVLCWNLLPKIKGMTKFKKLSNIILFLLIAYYLITQFIILTNRGKITLYKNTFQLLQFSEVVLIIIFVLYIGDLIKRILRKEFNSLFIINTVLVLMNIPAVIKTILLNLRIIPF